MEVITWKEKIKKAVNNKAHAKVQLQLWQIWFRSRLLLQQARAM